LTPPLTETNEKICSPKFLELYAPPKPYFGHFIWQKGGNVGAWDDQRASSLKTGGLIREN